MNFFKDPEPLETPMPIKILARLIPFLLMVYPFEATAAQEPGDEETYSISLIQTAEVDKEIIEVDNKKVLTESYEIRKGDHVWQLLRERGLLKKNTLAETLHVLKTLNTSFQNLDLVHPGEKILIPLTIVPIDGLAPRAEKTSNDTEVEEAEPVSIENLKDLNLEYYTIKPGDSLTKVIKGRYNVPLEDIQAEYLNLIKKLNPSIKDLDTVYPGQKVRLPIYSPQVVRKSIEAPSPSEPEPEKEIPVVDVNLKAHLREIFMLMGEEWVETGEHFIPLRQGGQINLKAESYPIISLSNGTRVVIDLQHGLPEKMVDLIESSWENYRIFRLQENDDLRTAIDRILPLCNHATLYRLGQPLELGGDITIRLTADWIIEKRTVASEAPSQILMVNMIDSPTDRTPGFVIDFLASYRIEVIDYPPSEEAADEPADGAEILSAGNEMSGLVEILLNLLGQRFAKDQEIPVYQSHASDFNLIIKADFLYNRQGVDYIIDLTGLGADVITLLKDHRFAVLSLAGEVNPPVVLTKTLDFAGAEFDAESHAILAMNRAKTRNVEITLPGIKFRNHSGSPIFATQLDLPSGVGSVLSQQGYKILQLSPSWHPLSVESGVTF
jgi:LysM repeat protein